MKRIPFFILTTLLLAGVASVAQNRPSLFLTRDDVGAMKEAIGKYPLFERSIQEARTLVDRAISRPMDVPIPKDAGGYTHETHKQNYTAMHLAGILYQVTGQEKYASFIREMLLKYADLYPTLGKHPAAAGEASGRLFWQTLNETVWLVHATQAYDCVVDHLSLQDRRRIEENVFRPMARFFVEEHTHELDRIHNHGTWTCAAVGMAGYILGDRELSQQALYGSKKDGSGGYLKQLELLFSPDGYYTEGPYYVRYALWPFYTFAQVIENNEPNLKIFDFRNGILGKALHSALQLTYTNGAFIPFNDALKEKSYFSPEIVIALNIAYIHYGDDRSLLPIAKKHNIVMLSGAGVEVAKALAENPDAGDFPYASVEYSDGADGTEGGLGILRYGPNADQSLLLMKYTAHGLSHGHYDKLSILYYDQDREMLQDYGSARFINVEPKYGGRYLPENKSFALQTIAHNTVTVDQQSQYGGNIRISEQHHANRHFFTASDKNYQVMSAKVTGAYEGIALQRTVAMVNDDRFPKPVVIDLFKINSKDEHTYDLPFYYMGHLIATNVNYTAHQKQRTVWATANGYQHLWLEAEGTAPQDAQVSWLAGERYYTVTSDADSTTHVYFVRIGANDPNFNLRNEPAFVLRRKARSYVFASVLEPHGRWDGIKEFSANARPMVKSIAVLLSNQEATVAEITGENGLEWLFFVANGDASDTQEHSVTVRGKRYTWTGNSYLLKEKGTL
ncbi:MAG: heparinase II/III family protein [Bacteroidota bacterium]